MGRLFKSMAMASLALSMVLGVACGSDPGVVTPNNDNTVQPPPAEVPFNSRLVYYTPCEANSATCSVPLVIDGIQEIGVRLLDGNNQPLANRLVRFALTIPEGDLGAQGTTLSTANAVTDNNGIATTTIRASNNPETGTGSAEIVASVENVAQSLRFAIGVSSKDRAQYEVHFSHVGSATFDRVRASLFDSAMSCADIAEYAARNRNALPTSIFSNSTTVDADGTIYPVIFPNQPNGASYTVVGQAWAPGTNNTVEVVYGCKDNNPAIQNGVFVRVDVQLIDHLPHVQGTYAVTHTFDLREALPQNVRTVIDIIGQLATNPASVLLGCRATYNHCQTDSVGLLGLIAELGFLPDTVRDFLNTLIGTQNGHAIATSLINEFVNGWINSGDAPDWVRNAVNITADIYDTLRTFRVDGRLFINEAPQVQLLGNEVVGLLPENGGHQIWNTLTFYWSRGCENQGDACREVPVRANNIGASDNIIRGEFDGAIYGANKLEINQHTLSLHYGVLLMAVIEKVVFPLAFGNDIQSLDDLLASFINCASIAQNAGFGGLEQACNMLLTTASSSLRDYVTGQLIFDGDDHFLIGTPSGEPCTLYQPDTYSGSNWPGYPLPYIQRLGKADPSLQCKWDVQIKFSETNITRMNGKFYGERDGFN
jgi:hypothetical protein